MDSALLFKIANLIATTGWVLMAIMHDRPLTYRLIFNGVVVLLCAFYASVIVWSFSEPSSGGNFSSLEGVMALFTNPKAMLGGWIHYLAFDMMTGLFIISHSSKNAINRWLILPCLFFTFMLGPIGLLLYYILLCIKKKNLLPVYL